jgi:hypothetical protein
MICSAFSGALELIHVSGCIARLNILRVRRFRRLCNGVCEGKDICWHYSGAVFEVYQRTYVVYWIDPPGVGCGDCFRQEMAKAGTLAEQLILSDSLGSYSSSLRQRFNVGLIVRSMCSAACSTEMKSL